MRHRSFAMSTRRGNVIFSESVDKQYLVGSSSLLGHSISSHSGRGSSCWESSCATQTLTRANRDDSGLELPSRHLTSRQARLGRPRASSFTETGSDLRRFARRPLPSNSITLMVGWIPATYFKPSVLTPARNLVLLPYPASISTTPRGMHALQAASICSNAISGLVLKQMSFGTCA